MIIIRGHSLQRWNQYHLQVLLPTLITPHALQLRQRLGDEYHHRFASLDLGLDRDSVLPLLLPLVVAPFERLASGGLMLAGRWLLADIIPSCFTTPTAHLLPFVSGCLSEVEDWKAPGER